MAFKKEIFQEQTAPKLFTFGGSCRHDLHLSHQREINSQRTVRIRLKINIWNA